MIETQASLALERITRMTKRSHDEIVKRIETMRSDDYFGFQTSDLLTYLPWDKAKPFLREGANESEWRAAYPLFKPPLREAKEYLKFAWDKANNCRGISVMRSMEHFKAWLWLAGFDEKFLTEHFDEYEYYSKPQLVLVSKLVDFNWIEEDNGAWLTNETGPKLSDDAIQALVAEAQRIVDEHMKE